MSPTPAPTNNPILDEIQRAHASLSPQARTVMERAGITLPQGPAAGLNAPPPEATPVQPKSEPLSPAFLGSPSMPRPPIETLPDFSDYKPTPIQGLPPAMIGNAASPDRPTPMAAPPPGGLIRRPIADFAPKQAEHQTEADRLRDPDLGKTGIQKLPGIARVPLQVLDAIGSGLFPNITMGIPGTAAHHMLLQHNADRAVEGDTAAMDAAAKRQLEGSQGTEAEARAATEPSQADLREAQAANIKNPPHKPIDESQTRETDEGIFQLNPETGKYDIRVGNAPGKSAMQHVVTPDGSVIAIEHDPKTGKVNTEVVYKGDPKVETEVADLEVNGKPHKVIVDRRTGTTIKDLGPSGIKPPVTNINAETSALDRESARFSKPHESMRTAASSQLEKITDAQAMISGNAEAQALGIPKVLTALVSGQGSGVRITQAELNNIGKARGLAGDVEGTIRKWMGKGQLTPQQQQQLVGVLEDAKSRILQKQQIASGAIDKINGAKTREEMIAADKEARDSIDKLERGGSSGGNDAALKAYADKYFGGDQEKAKASMNGGK